MTTVHVNSENDVAFLSYARALKMTAGWFLTHGTFVTSLALYQFNYVIDSFSHIPILHLATYCIIFLVTSLRLIFTVNDAGCTNQLETVINSTIKQ